MLDLYEQAIQREVCSRCIDFGEDGICHSSDPQGCAVFRYLPALAGIARRLQAVKIEPYQQAVRDQICSRCENQKNGKCGLRDAADCSLDRYLPLVIEAIEKL